MSDTIKTEFSHDTLFAMFAIRHGAKAVAFYMEEWKKTRHLSEEDIRVAKLIDWANDNTPAKATAPRVMIFMDGGLVSCVLSDVAVKATVIDYDVGDLPEEDLTMIPQDDGSPEQADVRGCDIEVNPDRINELEKAIS